MSQKIRLTKGYHAVVDDADFDWVSEFKWCVNTTKNGYRYAVRSSNGKLLGMHRAISGARQGLVVDHRNGNTLDNRRSNLRVCSQSENLLNKRNAGGVNYDWMAKKWETRVKFQGKTYRLGKFKNKSEALKVCRDFRNEILAEHDEMLSLGMIT